VALMDFEHLGFSVQFKPPFPVDSSASAVPKVLSCFAWSVHHASARPFLGFSLLEWRTNHY
jgi:hypothetical protein